MRTHSPSQGQKSDDIYIMIENNNKRLYRLAYTFVNNREDALDIVQESVYKAIVSYDKLKNPEFFNTWLYRITINCANDFLRKSQRIDYTNIDFLESIMAYSHNNRDEILDVQKALANLEPKYKTVVIMKFFRDMTFSDIALTLDISNNTVKSRLYRGLRKLKMDLKDVDNHE